MNFDQLRYVITIAEEKSFSVAAKKLYVTQPSLSQSISSLEQELNTSLFFRTTNIVELTYSGEEFIKMAQQILLMKANYYNRISDVSDSQFSRLSIVTSYFRNAIISPAIIPPFSKKYPNTEIDMFERQLDQQEELVQKGVVDFAILNGKMKNPNICYKTLQESTPFVIALPSNHPFKKYKDAHIQNISDLPSAGLSEIQNERFILLERGHRYRTVFQNFLDKNGIAPPKQTFKATNILSALNLVSRGYGMTIVPKVTAQLAFFSPCPIYFQLGDYYDEPLYAAYHKDRPLSSMAKNFCNIAIRVLSDADSNNL